MGVPLRKYPALYEALIKKIQAPISKGFEFSIPKGRYTSPLSPTLRDLIRQQVEAIPDEAFAAIRASALSYAESKRIDGRCGYRSHWRTGLASRSVMANCHFQLGLRLRAQLVERR